MLVKLLNNLKAVEALNNYFVPKENSAFARQSFHIKYPTKQVRSFNNFQHSSEKQRKIVTFTDTDNQIRDAILNKCASSLLTVYQMQVT